MTRGGVEAMPPRAVSWFGPRNRQSTDGQGVGRSRAKRSIHSLAPLAVLALAAATIGACAPPTPAPGAGDGGVNVAGPPQTVLVRGAAPIDVVLSDSGPSGPMSLVPFDSSASAGDVTFTVKNTGTIDHEMVVLKTDTAFDQLPVGKTEADKVDESANVGETGDPALKPGETRSFTIKAMAAGKYVLVCNIAKHYAMGMRAPFTVT